MDRREVILQRLEEGESLASICRDEGMPDRSAVLRWAEKDTEFGQRYAAARARGYALLAEQILEIADTPVEGVTTTIKGDGSVEEKRADMIEHRRLQIDARKWMLSKMLPKIYGDRLKLDADLNVKRTANELTDDELAAIIAQRPAGDPDR